MCSELQAEEIEVLHSIYDGDDCFIEVNDVTYQYKVVHNESNRSFLIEVKWGVTYPEDLPDINLETFFNKHLTDDVKKSIADRLRAEAEGYLGSAMTFTLFEYAKENSDELTAGQPEVVVADTPEAADDKETIQVKKVKERKEQLTKNQKRRLADRTDNKGERPRGWNWVDVVKHLSQTGKKEDT